jgi:predicted DNA-binding transcriptional regulator AlpA
VKEPPFHIMRRPEVEETTGLSCSAIYRAMSVGTFPKPTPIDRDSLPRAE